jgi:hypothetical protein
MFTLMENQCWSKFGVGQIRKWKMDKDNFSFYRYLTFRSDNE